MSRHGEVYDRDLNLTGIRDTLYMKRLKDDSFPLHGIWVYSGSQGSGKTLNMIHTLLEIRKNILKL